MAQNTTLVKVMVVIAMFIAVQVIISWRQFAYLSDDRMTLQAEVDSLRQRKDSLLERVTNLERNKHRLELQQEKLDTQIRDLLPLTKNRLKLPTIFFVTPTKRRPEQRADLTRLAQSLSVIPNLYWVVVEDAEEPSPVIDEILRRTKLTTAHLTAVTPPEQRMSDKDPNWRKPRGVVQRNAALDWLRTNFMTLNKGVLYFGDDDNTYDWSLFEEMRRIEKVGIWPVGLVGGQFVETPLVDEGKVVGFNAVWKRDRPFPIDMAAFSVNISLVIRYSEAKFSFSVPRGYQESHFLTSLNLSQKDLEPKASQCSKVLVWHTRTEKSKLNEKDLRRFYDYKNITGLEAEAVI